MHEDLVRMSDGELVELQDALHASPIGTVSPAIERLLKEIDEELDRRLPDANANTAEEVVTDAAQLPGELVDAVERASTGANNLAVNAGIGGVVGLLAAKLLNGSGGMGILAGVIAGAILRPFGSAS